MSNPFIACTLVGCRNTAQLEENIKSLSHPIDPEIKKRLDDATQLVKHRLGARTDYFQSKQETRSW
jgi:aryl-alcohol dehydrogenase-like predicted oxidoreductase